MFKGSYTDICKVVEVHCLHGSKWNLGVSSL